jgi:hypothetical protein
MRSAAVLFLAVALVACASPRVACERLWPGYERAVFEVRDGREGTEALPVARIESRWGGTVEVRYQQGEAIVSESSVIAASGASWRRRFVIEALPANRELVVRVPTRAGSGRLLSVAVNGAPLVPEPGALESVIHLARDEATVITVRDAAAP